MSTEVTDIAQQPSSSHFPVEMLSRSPLFTGISAEDIATLLACRSASIRKYEKGEVIWHAGDTIHTIGFLCQGIAQVTHIDSNGKRAIHATMKSGETFGSAFVCAKVPHMPHGVVAVDTCRVLFLNYRAIIETCTTACTFHRKIIENLIVALAEETLSLKHKMRIIAKQTTREKLLAYLEDEAGRRDTRSFVVPFKRQELADYLGVERSALSAEISKLRNEGVLESDRSHFKLLK